MAYAWKTEFHVFDVDGDAFEWLPETGRDRAIAMARECSGRVEKVTSYLDDREEIFNAAAAEDEE